MSKIITSLQRSQNSLLESPTGERESTFSQLAGNIKFGSTVQYVNCRFAFVWNGYYYFGSGPEIGDQDSLPNNVLKISVLDLHALQYGSSTTKLSQLNIFSPFQDLVNRWPCCAPPWPGRRRSRGGWTSSTACWLPPPPTRSGSVSNPEPNPDSEVFGIRNPDPDPGS